MFLIDWIPASFFIPAFFVGLVVLIASPLISHLPFFAPYKLPVNALAIAVMVGAVWMHGAVSTKQEWEQKLVATQAELRVAKLEVQAAKENIIIEEKVVTKIQYIKEKTNENVRIIEKLVPVIDANCKLPDAAVVLIDSASKAEVAGSTPEAPRPSDPVEASDVLKTVVENYGICNEHIEIIKGWQDWYWKQKRIFEQQ